jgi:hypothetical protein
MIILVCAIYIGTKYLISIVPQKEAMLALHLCTEPFGLAASELVILVGACHVLARYLFRVEFFNISRLRFVIFASPHLSATGISVNVCAHKAHAVLLVSVFPRLLGNEAMRAFISRASAFFSAASIKAGFSTSLIFA